MILPGLLGLFALTLFFRSMAFFDGTRMLSKWYFLRPSEAIAGIESLIELPLYPLHLVALAIFPVNRRLSGGHGLARTRVQRI